MFLMERMMILWPIVWAIGPARMIGVTSEVLSARSVDRPTAVDLEEIAVASGLKFIGLLGRELAAFVFDNESSLLDRRCRKKAHAGAGTADTESSLAGHMRMYDDSRPRNHIEAGAQLISATNA